MVRIIQEKYRLDSPQVLSVMLQIPREEFVSKKYGEIVYADQPIPIGFSQTMSQPYTVAFMTHLLIDRDRVRDRVKTKSWRVLEIGTGSGYQAAVLSRLVKKVYTIEIVPELAIHARTVLTSMGYKNIYIKTGSGEWGWPEKAPFDAIIITAGVETIPATLFDQLRDWGVLVAPIGKGEDKVMTRYIKTRLRQDFGEAKKETFGIFHFVPFVETG